MRVIEMARATGKTTKLIEISAKSGAIIICRTHYEVDAIQAVAKHMNLKIPTPISYKEILEGRHLSLGTMQKFLVDDVDLFIERIVGRTVTYVTYTPS